MGNVVFRKNCLSNATFDETPMTDILRSCLTRGADHG